MSGPVAAAGAQSSPTRYGALAMGGEQFTGCWTQRSPYRDAATAYLIKKFYQGSRFDSILDGINREISARLTDVRRPGCPPFGTSALPSRALSFYSFKSIGALTNAEQCQIIADAASTGSGDYGGVYDLTGGLNYRFLSKTINAGRMRFLGLLQSLFMADGAEQKKLISPGGWVAFIPVQPGTLINNQAYNENGQTMQMALGGIQMAIVGVERNINRANIYFDPSNIPDQFANLVGTSISFSGLTTATYLNATTKLVTDVVSSTLGILTVALGASGPVVPFAEDTGTGTTGGGTTGATAPTFSGTEFAVVADAGQQWKCYGPSLENWGLAVTAGAPTLTPQNGTRFWQPNTSIPVWYAILDNNQNVQVNGYAIGVTGLNYPPFAPLSTTTIAQTVDGSLSWNNWGQIALWAAVTAFGSPQSGQAAVILDPNQNLQLVTNGNGGNSGASMPTTWATSIGFTTSDGALTWTCLGPGVTLTTASIQYAFSTHAIDGSVSTASRPAIIQGPILGKSQTPGQDVSFIELSGNFAADTQIDKIRIWRTPQGQATLILEDDIPADLSTTSFIYNELGITDTSANGGGALNALIAAPVASANNPPPVTMTAPTYHVGRVFAISQGKVIYSGGPDTVVGNGNTAFPPNNYQFCPAQPVRLVPITLQNGALLVFTTSGVQILFGTGTTSNPFYLTNYYDKVNLASYDALDVWGTEIFLMESNAKVSALAIQYPFNPSTGYTEIGFPIGDQFVDLTTGGGGGSVYNPATAYLSWNIANSMDTAMYVADGTVGWFRMSAVSPPESGYMWCPRAVIAGQTSAVQSIETSPGKFTLLIGPPTGGGPVLMRDTSGTVWADGSTPTPYSSWDAKGVNLLCSTGQWTEVAHISAKSKAVGARPVISVILNEIEALPAQGRPWDVLEITSQDPVRGRKSKSVFSDRYALAQNGEDALGDCILTKFDYGSQAVGDELFDWGIFATTDEERKEEAAQAR